MQSEGSCLASATPLNVHDEHGQLIPANGSTVVFFYNLAEHSRYAITSVGDKDFNYEIRMKMDMNRSGTSVYDSLAVNFGVAYTLAIDIGGVLYYPIEISTPPDSREENPARALKPAPKLADHAIRRFSVAEIFKIDKSN